MGLTLAMALEFYTIVGIGLNLKVKKNLGLILTFVEVAGEKPVRETILHLAPTHSEYGHGFSLYEIVLIK